MTEKLRYVSPKDEHGNDYWVPIVIKNKDYLVGLVSGVHKTLIANEVDDVEFLNTLLGSDRFVDILPDGRIVGDMSDKEFRDFVKETIFDVYDDENKSNLHPDNKVVMDYFLGIDCTCGNFVGFKTVKEIPEEDMRCGCCDKLFIQYTNHNDSDYEYHGEIRDVEEVIESVKKELGIDDEDDQDNW